MIFYKFIGVCSEEYYKKLRLDDLRECGTYLTNSKFSSINTAFYNSYKVEDTPLVTLCAKDEKSMIFVAACESKRTT